MVSDMGKWFVLCAAADPTFADFLCPLSGRIMEDPVLAEDNFNYDRSAIEAWLKKEAVSPQTKDQMGSTLIESTELRGAIAAWKGMAPGGQQDTVAAPVQLEWPAFGRWTEKRSVRVPPADAPQSGAPAANADQDANASMTAKMSKAFQDLDPLRDVLHAALDGLTPPRVVVVGDESAGKSTVLEQLAMLPFFPRQRRFSTRMAIHLRLRRSSSSGASLCVHTIDAFGQETPESVPVVVPQENGWRWVQDEMDRLVREAAEGDATGIVSDKILVVYVRRPDVPTIDLVDLPGMTAMPREKVREIEAVFQRQLEHDRGSGGHSMFLAIIPASGDVRPSTNQAMNFITSNGLEARTLGVFTKSDQVADSDLLNALIRHECTSDGESPGDLGAVKVNGWIACMLKPPVAEELRTHNFERLLAQQKAEADFFTEKDPVMRALQRDGLAGIGPLGARLTALYFKYLRTTWKDHAFMTVFVKLAAKEFELAMLGVPEPAKRKSLAQAEVARRMGPSSPGARMRDTYFSTVVNGSLLPKLQSYLAAEVVPSAVLRSKLDKVRGQVMSIIEAVLGEVKSHWLEPLQELLSAESIMCPVHTYAIIAVMLRGEEKLRLFNEPKAHADIMQELRMQPLLQLSNFPSYTGKIAAACEAAMAESVAVVRGEVEELVHRTFDIARSPFLRFKPIASESQVEVDCDIQGFLGTLVTLFMTGLPWLEEMNLHVDLEVGDESEAAALRVASVKADMEQLNRAKEGVRRALELDDAELARIASAARALQAQALKKALESDSRGQVRLEAAKGLGNIGGPEVSQVLQDGAVFDAAVLDMSDSMLNQKFFAGVANMAAFSREIDIPTAAGLPHMFGNAFRNVASLVADIDFTFKEVEEVKKFLENPDAYAAANPVAAAPAAGGGGGGGTSAAARRARQRRKRKSRNADSFRVATASEVATAAAKERLVGVAGWTAGSAADCADCPAPSI